MYPPQTGTGTKGKYSYLPLPVPVPVPVPVQCNRYVQYRSTGTGIMLFALSAAAHLPQLVDTGKKAWSGIKSAKNAVEVVRRFKRAPEEMRFTFQLCAALLDALPVAEALATRHLSLRIVGAAVVLARQAAQQCDALQMDTEDVTDSEDGWAEWMRAGSKLEALHRVQSRLALAISSLQLALSAVAASSLGSGHATSSFHYMPAAFAQAHHALQQMEMGRTRSVLLCGGELWQRGPSPISTPSRRAAAASGGAMTKLFACRLRLHRGKRDLARLEEDRLDDWAVLSGGGSHFDDVAAARLRRCVARKSLRATALLSLSRSHG